MYILSGHLGSAWIPLVNQTGPACNSTRQFRNYNNSLGNRVTFGSEQFHDPGLDYSVCENDIEDESNLATIIELVNIVLQQVAIFRYDAQASRLTLH